MHLGETGITTSLLIDLKLAHPREVTIHPFSQRQEVTTGADWEWWFVGQNRSAIGFRVQAKVIHHATRRYETLHYRRKGVFQTDTLISNALSGFAPTIPLYCLYTEWFRTPQLRQRQWPCGTFPPQRESLGCSLMSPFIVRRMRKKDNLVDLLSNLRPWQCMVCCHAYGGNNLPERALRFYKNLMMGSTTGIILERGSLDGNEAEQISRIADLDVLPEIPRHVADLINGRTVPPPSPNLSGLLVIQEL
jgi:hypothetical protein